MELSKEQINFYKKFGILKVEKLMGKNEVKFFQNEISRLARSRNSKVAKYYQENLFGTKNDLFRIEHFYEFSKKFRTLIDSRKVKNVINKLAGKKSVLFKEKINIKPPYSREDRLHQDVQGDWIKYSNNFITFLVSLVKTDQKNGNLIFDESGNNKDKIRGEMFKVLKLKELKNPKFRNLPLNLGDVVFFNGYIPHKSTKNSTKKSRVQIYITYCVPKFKNTRNKYFKEKFQNCPPNFSDKKNKFAFKN